jgi:hypothetical protein
MPRPPALGLWPLYLMFAFGLAMAAIDGPVNRQAAAEPSRAAMASA